jgi:hypothetical protein
MCAFFHVKARSIYLASEFPMVSTFEELREAKEMAEEVRKNLGAPPAIRAAQ